MVTVSHSTELEEFAREERRRFEAGDEAWVEQTTAHGQVSSFGTARRGAVARTKMMS